jgi:hypothetical protein
MPRPGYRIDKYAEISGSSLKGYLPRGTTYAALVALFGPPVFEGDGDKVLAEWVLRFEDGLIATVYDYKNYGVPVESVIDWHIGGFEPSTVHRVTEVLREGIKPLGAT